MKEDDDARKEGKRERRKERRVPWEGAEVNFGLLGGRKGGGGGGDDRPSSLVNVTCSKKGTTRLQWTKKRPSKRMNGGMNGLTFDAYITGIHKSTSFRLNG